MVVPGETVTSLATVTLPVGAIMTAASPVGLSVSVDVSVIVGMIVIVTCEL